MSIWTGLTAWPGLNLRKINHSHPLKSANKLPKLDQDEQFPPSQSTLKMVDKADLL